MDLTDFLLARIAEDEAWVGGEDGEYLDECQECAFGQQPESPYSRTRVLAECDAKRRIVEEAARLAATPLQLPEDMQFVGAREALRATCTLLALPYAGHPDYLEEWRP